MKLKSPIKVAEGRTQSKTLPRRSKGRWRLWKTTGLADATVEQIRGAGLVFNF
jgi:hypothetical protein